jgi:hypothetical protein
LRRSRRRLGWRAAQAPALVICACLWACGAGTPPATSAPHPAPAEPVGGHAGDDPAAPATSPAAAGDAISDAECAQLADHLVELGRAESTKPRGDGYTDADAEAAKQEPARA